eukprot:9016089-Pyramimonas_sp.AAC.1
MRSTGFEGRGRRGGARRDPRGHGHCQISRRSPRGPRQVGWEDRLGHVAPASSRAASTSARRRPRAGVAARRGAGLETWSAPRQARASARPRASKGA